MTKNQNYKKFAELFPAVMSGEYSYLRLEAGKGMMPLSVEWVDKYHISIMHTYKMNGDLMYDPMMTFEIDSEAGSMRATEFQQSMPPVYQYIDNKGVGTTVNSRGDEIVQAGLQGKLDDFASSWLENINNQGYLPVRGIAMIGEDDAEILFDDKGEPIPFDPAHDEATTKHDGAATQRKLVALVAS